MAADQTRALRARIDELEERLRQSEALLRPVFGWPETWRLTPQQTRLLAALYKDPGIQTYERLAHVVSIRPESEDQDPNTVKVQLSYLRKKLPAGIVIKTHWSIGLQLVAGRDILRAALAGEPS